MSTNAEFHNLQKYGVPLYGAGWVPYDHVRSKLKPEEDKKEEEEEEDQNGSQDEAVTDKSDEISSSSNDYYVVLTGGGGEGRSGIRNAVLLSHFDFTSNSLSDQPVAELRTGSDLPYRMAIHPRRDGIICAMQNSCRLFEWDEVDDTEVRKLSVKMSEKVLSQLEDVGQQLALAFDSEGATFATGSEDGNLRVFKWPSMEIILNESQDHASVKDLSFSPDGKYLVSLGNRGPARVWDVTSSTVVASLPKENDEFFASCRFSPIDGQNSVLYIAAITDKGGSIVTWNTNSWKRIRSKKVDREPISSFNVSADGKLLAIGTAQGDISIIDSSSMKVQQVIKKAHLGIVTALAFSHDSRALVSASMDSSARVTLVEDKKKGGGLNMWIIIFVVLLAMAAYILKNKGIIP
ncbi:SEC12-like protein 2 [Melia azedarach]|uniref:SEC12-like protein 2 n=1 Tax=Melia azedarach TaxID=155640 RepID=A0ACC1XG27_MELAZ|nr:SEC12-like protein 2 [Melia azedarach]